MGVAPHRASTPSLFLSSTVMALCPRTARNPPNDEFYDCIQKISLTEPHKSILTTRYLQVVHGYESRVTLYSYAFHSLRTAVTVGSLIVPALLAVDFVDTSAFQFKVALYWITWCLSLLVTISNGIYTLYKIDKKYYMLHTVYQQLRSEGWQYLMLAGRYNTQGASHLSNFPSFCLMIEKIKMRQVEDEYYKINEHHPTSTSSIVPSSTTSKFDMNSLKELLSSKKEGLFHGADTKITQQDFEKTAQTNSATANAAETEVLRSGSIPENVFISFGTSSQSNPFFSESNRPNAPE
jgi:Protein of unknown function (DUF4231)